MTDKLSDPAGGRGQATGVSAIDCDVDHSMVLIVGRSQINRVVVARIVERSGLRPHSEPPDLAARFLLTAFPGTVILDGGPDNRDCEALFPRLVTMRGLTGACIPAIILLSTHNMDEETRASLVAVDAVVAKPILPELLQPVLDRLVHRAVG